MKNSITLASVILISACGSLPQTPHKTHWEQLYQQRLEARTKEGLQASGLASYAPLESIGGSKNHQPLPTWSHTPLPIELSALATMQQWARESNANALLIMVDGKLVSETYFDGVDAATPIVSRSLSKPLAVVAVGRAIEKGFIRSIHQSAADFLHEWSDTPKAPITIAHLLNMRSGLMPQDFAADRPDIMSRAYLHPDHAQIIIDDYPLLTPPGTRHDYANANIELIAPIIERATGQRYAQWVAEEIIKPLGARGGEIWINRPAGMAHSGCCALLPAETWMRLSLLLLNDGQWGDTRLLPAGFVEMMKESSADFPHSGMGIYLAGTYIPLRGAFRPDEKRRDTWHSEPYLARDLFLFDGNANQVSYIIPRHNMIILRTGTKPDADFKWDNAWLPNTALKSLARQTGATLIPQPIADAAR